MGKWALKTTREKCKRKVEVFPIYPAPPGARPYRMKYSPENFAETVQIFDSRREAEAAYHAELLAAEYSAMTDQEVKARFEEDLALLRPYKIELKKACRLFGLNVESIFSALKRDAYQLDIRQAARFHIMTQRLLTLIASAPSVLPESGSTGKYRLGIGRGRKPKDMQDTQD